MPNSIKNTVLFILTISVLFAGCISSRYKIHEATDDLLEIVVSTDRIAFECQDADADDRERTTGFMMYVLDDANTVTTYIHPSLLGEKDCDQYVEKIKKIMSRVTKIYIAGSTGNFNSPRIQDKKTTNFQEKANIREMVEMDRYVL